MLRTLVAAGMLAVGAPAWAALGAQRLLAHAHHTKWTEADGLPYAAFDRVIRTPDGYLWLAGEGPLVRFDGVRYTTFDGTNTPALASTFSGGMRPLMIDRDGTMWIARLDGALVQYRDGRFRVAGQVRARGQYVSALAQDGTGRVWAMVSPSGGLHFVDGDSLIPAPLPEWLPKTEVLYLIADAHDGVLVGTHTKGIAHLTPGGATVYARPPTQRRGATRPLLQGRDGAIWAYAEGLQVMRHGRWTRPELPGTGERLLPTAATESADGAVWIATRGHGVLRFANGRMEQFTERDGLSDAVANAVAADEEGNAWIVTEAGLDRLRGAPFASLGRLQGLPFDSPRWIGPDASGAIWLVALPGMRLYRIDGGIVRDRVGPVTAQLPRGTATTTLMPLTAAHAGGVWTYDSRTNAITRVDVDRDGPLDVVAGADVLIAFESRSRELWVGTAGRKVGWWSAGQWRYTGILNESDSSHVFEIGEDSAGRMMIVADGAPNLTILRHDTLVARLGPGDGLARPIRHLVADGVDTLWARDTDSSLYRIIGGKVSRLTNPQLVPLLQGRSMALLPAGDRFFIASTSGITSVPRAALHAAADHRAPLPKLRRYSALDGAPTARLTVLNASPAFRAADGRVWFSTPGGLLVYDERDDVPNAVAPRVHIEEVRAADSALTVDSVVPIPPGAQRVELRFTVTALRIPERARLEFRLDGVDADWRTADASRRVTYTQLRPRRYVFRVRGWNEDGVPAVADAVVRLRVMPLWFQSWWFLSLAVLFGLGAIAGAVGLVLLARARQTSARLAAGFEATLAERTRVAGELHDTLLQAFTGVTLQLQALRSRMMAAPDEAERDLGRVLVVADEALRDARSAVWDLRAPELEGRDVGAALEDSARAAVDAHLLAGGAPVDLVMGVTGHRRRVARSIETAAQRIGREAVANALRHACAKRISVRVAFEPRELCLEVRDDGVGFEVTRIQPREGRGHWGLVGMRERARNAGGTLDVTSLPTSGTTLVLRLPVDAA